MDWIGQWKARASGTVRIIAFGSSNTELTLENAGRHNWVDWLGIQLRLHVGRHIHVINQGISGDTAEMLLARIDRDVVSYRPDAVIITIGGNDANAGVPPEIYAGRIREMCGMLRAGGAVPILQTYYCPLYHEAGAGYAGLFEANMQAKRDIADELGLPLIDQYRRFEPMYRRYPDEYAKLMRDWLHLNALGNLLMAQNICDRLGLPPIPAPQGLAREADTLLARMDECSPRLHP
jgi:lysophospholipase L1-like esterase